MSTGPSERPPAPSGLRELFAARLREALHTGGDRTRQVSRARRAYREAACLLARFDPRLLRLPGEKRATGGAVLELVDDCTTLGMPDQPEWALRAEVREETLRGLAGPEAARRLLACNIGQLPTGPGPERFALAHLFGNPPATERLGADELAEALQAVLWLSQVPRVTGLPDPAELQHALERARLLEPSNASSAGPSGAFPGDGGTAGLRRHAGCAGGAGRPAGGPRCRCRRWSSTARAGWARAPCSRSSCSKVPAIRPPASRSRTSTSSGPPSPSRSRSP
ncbi:hypothetical protein PQR15_33370 [Streptomyces lydicus]|nr:hypothetical protein [Streptomyces lydicus]